MGDSDEDMEPMTMSERDLENVMNPGRWRNQTKNQATYGVWADPESDEEEQRRGFGGGGGKPKNYTTPVTFVSGGVKEGNKMVDKAEGDEEIVRQFEGTTSSSSKPTEQIDLAPHRGAKPQRKGLINSGRVGLGGGSAFAGLDGGGGGSGANQKLGEWEKHTKGAAMKMMLKMGYKKGEGLGSKGQGIIQPVEANLRKGRGAVGAYGPESKAAKLAAETARRPAVVSSDSDDDRRGRASGRWRRNAASASTPKYKYRTVDEVIAEGGVLAKRMGMQENRHSSKIIDMTGRQTKVYSGYDAESVRPEDAVEKSKKAFNVTELTHNLDILLETAEEEIVRRAKEKDHLTNQTVALKRDRQDKLRVIDNEQEHHDRIVKCKTLIEDFNTASTSGTLTLTDAEHFFSTIVEDYRQEYKLYGLDALIKSCVNPIIRSRTLNGWSPSLSHEQHATISSTLRRWRTLLGKVHDETSFGLSDGNPYDVLIWDTLIVPHFTKHVRDTWHAKEESIELLDLIDAYRSCLPGWAVKYIFEECIMRKLDTLVDEWDPQTDTIPIHTWLLPWQHISPLNDVYSKVRRKLGRALQKWDAKDTSALHVLKPWHTVWREGEMSAFLAMHIMPKLDQMMQRFSVNPAKQDLTEIKALLAWRGVLSDEQIARVLDKRFFPKWQTVLYNWLSSSESNLAEVAQWFSGWKSQLPPEINSNALIAKQFTFALQNMERVTNGHVARLPPRGLTEEVPQPAAAAPTTAPPKVHLTFRDMIERSAHTANLPFYPVIGKQRMGKQVYHLGRQQVYLDMSVLYRYVQPPLNGLTWVPCDAQQLIFEETHNK